MAAQTRRVSFEKLRRRLGLANLLLCIFGLLLVVGMLLATVLLTLRVLQVQTQKVNWDVASHVAAQLPSVEDMEFSTPSILQVLHTIQPEVKLYIISTSGKVLYPHSTLVKRSSVGLKPIQDALADHSPQLPLWGDDPGTTDGAALISVAELAHGTR